MNPHTPAKHPHRLGAAIAMTAASVVVAGTGVPAANGTPSPVRTVTTSTQLSGRLGLGIMDFIKGGAAIYKFASNCSYNMGLNPPQSCFTQRDKAQFNVITSQLADIQAQIAANQAEIMRALTVIYKDGKYQAERQNYKDVEDALTEVTIAGQKYNDYLGCQTYVDAQQGQNPPPAACTLTNRNGNTDAAATVTYGRPTSVADLYRDLDKGASGGVVARLVDATIGEWAPGATDPNVIGTMLSKEARFLQQHIGGADDPTSTLLFSMFDVLNADAADAQGGKIGDTPVFLPPDYLRTMNQRAQYYVNQQGTYFASVIAALELQSRGAGPLAQLADDLQDLAENGPTQNKAFALPAQSTTWSFPGVDSMQDTESRIIGPDANLYSLNRVTPTPTPNPDYSSLTPSFALVSRMSGALVTKGIKMSTLRGLYPKTLPAGDRAAWWAQMSDVTRRFQLQVGVGSWRHLSIQNLDYWTYYPGGRTELFGDNVAVTYDEACQVPVRLWDSKPTQDQVWSQDRNSGSWGDMQEWSGADFYAIKRGDGKKYYDVTPDSAWQYNAMVTNGAAPVYDYGVTTYADGGLNIGPGTLWRCDGRFRTEFGNPVNASTMDIGKVAAPTGLYTRLLPAKPTKFRTCRALRKAEAHGIGTKKAARVHGQLGKTRTPLDFRVSRPYFVRNRHLDKDHDGIACPTRPIHHKNHGLG